MLNPFTKTILTALMINLFLSSNAYAYLDAGTGSMILQAALGGIAGLIVLVRMYWKEFTAFFRGRIEKKD